MRWLAASIVLLNFINSAFAETVEVKYHGLVNIGNFDCNTITRSSFIRRVCYNNQHSYMIISLDYTYYHYCSVDPTTVRNFLNAESMGRYYNANIRSQGSRRGPFDCRDHPVPKL